MPDTEGLTAVLLQLQGLTQQLAELDHRQAGDVREITERISGLAALVNSIKSSAADEADTLAAIKAIHERIDQLAAQIASEPGGDDAEIYQPCPSRRWWKLEGLAREAAIASLRAWVEQIYLPGYGYLAASLGGCWDQHPLCPYALDWLSELWSVLYLESKRTRPALAGQAEWQTRLLVAVAEQLAHETRRCSHAVNRPRMPIRTAVRP